MIYFIIFILLFIPVVKYDWLAKSGGENTWYYLSLVVLILFAGLRYRVGGDTMTYMEMFEEIPRLSEYKYFDFFEAAYQPLWYLLSMLSKSISEDFTCFQLIHATIVNISFFSFFRRYCPKYYFSAILLYYFAYFCYFNMEVLRESLCISILLWATPALLQKRWLAYYGFCLIGFFVHYSSMIMFVFPLLFWLLKRPNWRLQLVIFVCVFIAVSMVSVIDIMLKVLPISPQFVELLENYLDSERNIFGILSQFLSYLPILGMIYLHEQNEDDIHIPFVPLILGVVIVNTMAMNLSAFDRLNNYFKPFILVYLVQISYYILSTKRFVAYQKSYCVLIISLFLFVFNSLRYYTNDLSDIYPNSRFTDIYHPYHSVLDPVVDEHRERIRENMFYQ